MFLVWWIFMYRSVDVIGGVDFYVPFGRCYWWGGFCMHRSVDVIGGVDF
jgi:hypothetical protein